MKAVTFQGAKDIKVKNVDDPKIEKHDDILVKVISTAICGFDLHIYLGGMPMLFDKITKGEFDPAEIISHVVPLEEAATAYQRFHNHEDECIKVILKP